VINRLAVLTVLVFYWYGMALQPTTEVLHEWHHHFSELLLGGEHHQAHTHGRGNHPGEPQGHTQGHSHGPIVDLFLSLGEAQEDGAKQQDPQAPPTLKLSEHVRTNGAKLTPANGRRRPLVLSSIRAPIQTFLQPPTHPPRHHLSNTC
jgi:hypothetical protein